jgi:hypothetical protein
MYTGRVAVVIVASSGTVNVVTGFPVTRAIVTFATLPIKSQDEEMSSSSSIDSDSSSSSSSMSMESESSYSEIITGLPRIYVSAYLADGFTVTYENISLEIGYIEFSYSAV